MILAFLVSPLPGFSPALDARGQGQSDVGSYEGVESYEHQSIACAPVSQSALPARSDNTVSTHTGVSWLHVP